MGEDALFAIDEPTPVEAPPQPARILTVQVDQVRKALDGLNLATMAERQTVVEEILGRPIATLRDLFSEDVRPLLEGIHVRKPKQGTEGSAWDERDEDTWIDRL